MVLHDFVRRRRPSVSSDEEKALRVWFPLRSILFEDSGQSGGNRQDRLARCTLDGLDFAVPGRSADVKQFALQVNISPLQAECFSGTQSLHRQNAEESSPRLLS